MTNKDIKPEQAVKALLMDLGKQGLLYETLTEDEIETLLSKTSEVVVSDTFKERVFRRMHEAQSKREASLPTSHLGYMLLQARKLASLSITEISQQIKIAENLIAALEAGKLHPSQIIHNFSDYTMLRLLRILHIEVDSFAATLMEEAETIGRKRGFTEAQISYRKKSSDDIDVVTEVAEYIANLEDRALKNN